MSDRPAPRTEYLDRLSELLPPREARRVWEEVEALVLERAAGEREAHPEIDEAEAERRALAALGPPETLADELVSDPLVITLATRRLFVRVLAMVFAGHLLLSIVLTVAGSAAPALPGLLGPLPKESAAAVFLSVVAVFLVDTGLLLALFVALGSGRSERALRRWRVQDTWTRRGAVEGLLLLALVAVILNAFLDTVFAVRAGAGLQPFLTAEVTQIVPLVNAVLALFAVRHALTLLGRGRGVAAAAAEAAACLAGVAALILAATRGKLVQLPSAHLGREAAEVLDSLIERALLLVLVVGALLLTVRFVRQAIRTLQLLRLGVGGRAP